MLLPILFLTAPFQAELAPLDFLVGHCWRGDFSAEQQDTHCFDRTDAGQVRDRHEVVHKGEKVYWGETIYRWDAAASVIRYTYTDSSGGISTGTARPDGTGLDFGDESYTDKDGGKISLSTRWIRAGDDAYETLVTSSAHTGIPRRTRYVRID